MKTELKDNVLTLFLTGRVDTTNAAAVEAEINAACAEHPGCTPVVDMENLDYIASAGLRVLLRMRKNYGALTVVNVSRDVYEVLEMSGFTQMLDVKKAVRRISVEGCEMIGEGFNRAVYRLDPETIVKVYKPQVTMEGIEKELHSAKYAFTVGIPTAISFDIVKVGDGYGVVYELLNADVVSHKMMSDPENAEEYMRKFAELAKTMHNTDISASDLPKHKDLRKKKLDEALPYMTPEEKDAALRVFNALPDGNMMLHGDFHPKNVMIQDGEMMLIDMGDISKGHPVIEVLYLYGCMPSMVKLLPEELCMRYIGVDKATALNAWEWFKKYYLPGVPAEVMDLIEKAAELYSCYGKLLSVVSNPDSVIRPKLSAALVQNADAFEKLMALTAATVEKCNAAQAGATLM